MFRVVTFEYGALISLCRHLIEENNSSNFVQENRALSLHQQQYQELTMAGMGQ